MKPTGDLIKLSDLFRRSAAFENNDAVAELVAQAHKFACEVTWIDLSYPLTNEINRTTANFQKETLERLAKAAQDAGLAKVTLPLHKDSPFAQFVQSEVLDSNDFGVEFSFRSSEYRQDLAEVGNIDASIKTALDEGIRGVCAINSNLKYKWDSDLRPVPA